MNVYDFDKTIYDGDSTVDFYRYCLFRHPGLMACLPRQVLGFLQYMAERCNTTAFKESFFSFLPKIPLLNAEVERFWDLREQKIRAWYLAQKQSSDVVVSASPSFLLIPICDRLEIMPPIATRVDPATGRIDGVNCKGEEKVRRFMERYPSAEIHRFYSDSMSDIPLAELAQEAFLVRGNAASPWAISRSGGTG